MALTPTITYVARLGTQVRVGFKLAPSGTYVTGGDTVNFAAAQGDPAFVGTVPDIVALGPPLLFDVWSNGGNITTFYVPLLGTTQANAKLKVASALTTEITGAAAYPASVLADTIVGEATFNAL